MSVVTAYRFESRPIGSEKWESSGEFLDRKTVEDVISFYRRNDSEEREYRILERGVVVEFDGRRYNPVVEGCEDIEDEDDLAVSTELEKERVLEEKRLKLEKRKTKRRRKREKKRLRRIKGK